VFIPESYQTNPQYRIQITDADDDDEEEIGTIIVGLMQKGRRRLRAEGGGNLTMGYEIFSVSFPLFILHNISRLRLHLQIIKNHA